MLQTERNNDGESTVKEKEEIYRDWVDCVPETRAPAPLSGPRRVLQRRAERRARTWRRTPLRAAVRPSAAGGELGLGGGLFSGSHRAGGGSVASSAAGRERSPLLTDLGERDGESGGGERVGR